MASRTDNSPEACAARDAAYRKKKEQEKEKERERLRSQAGRAGWAEAHLWAARRQERLADQEIRSQSQSEFDLMTAGKPKPQPIQAPVADAEALARLVRVSREQRDQHAKEVKFWNDPEKAHQD